MGLNVDRILFFHGIENEPGKTQKWPQDQNHREESSKDGHPESVLFHVAQTHPDGIPLSELTRSKLTPDL